jgi:hypothetical protein
MPDDRILLIGPYPTYYLSHEGNNPEPIHRNPDAHHAFVAWRIPYLPTCTQIESREHPDYVAREIFRRFLFLTETISALDPRDVVALRILNQPHRPSRRPRLDLWLFAKSARPSEAAAEEAARTLRDLVEHAFPTEFPFGFPLVSASRKEIDIVQNRLIGRLQSVVEFHKYANADPVLAKMRFPHPYRTAPSLYVLQPLLSAIAASPDRHILSIALRSGELTDRIDASRLLNEFRGMQFEEYEFAEGQREMARRADERYQGTTVSREAMVDQRLSRAYRQPEDVRRHAQLGAQVFDTLFRNQDRLLLMSVTLGSWSCESSVSIAQAIRTTLSGEVTGGPNDTISYCVAPEAVRAKAEDNSRAFQIIADNLCWLEHQVLANGDNPHWRYLVTPEESVALLALPMPPEFGQVPGCVTRTEPFFTPTEVWDDPDRPDPADNIPLGVIYDRGVKTAQTACIPRDRIDQHVLIAGRSGSGKTNTCLFLLTQLAQEKQDIPFIVLDPLDKRDYRLLLGETSRLRDSLRVYTLGDEKTSPLVFNPFAIPPGITVQRHISQLLRCFLTAFVVSDPIPAIYRAALRQTYEKLQDRGELGMQMPNFQLFFRVLQKVARERSRDYSKEIQGNIRQMVTLRIGSLLEDNSGILNVSSDDRTDPFPDLISHPTVIEMGRIGSDEDKALIMAFLLVCLTPYIQNRPSRSIPHIIVIEEAHRLMRRGGATSDLRGDATQQTRSDFSNLLAEVRGYNQGIIVVDQSPGELVPAVFANTATHIMHQLRDPQSFEMMSSAFVLSPAQASYSRRLSRGHAITETADGTPIHIKPKDSVTELRDALRTHPFPDGESLLDPETDSQLVSDEAVRRIMKKHAALMPVAIVVPRYERLVEDTGIGENLTPGAIFELANNNPPFPSCLMCRPLRESDGCLYQERVDKARRAGTSPSLDKLVLDIMRRAQADEVWSKLARSVGPLIAKATAATRDEVGDVVYCLLAQQMQAFTRDPKYKAYLARYRVVLRDFHSRYVLPAEER